MQDKAKDKMILVAGAGGFIGGAMVGELRRQGYRNIRAVDVKPLDEWYQVFNDADNLILDLNLKESCERATEGAAEVYNFAANMGCLLYTSDAADERSSVDLGGRRIIK